MNHPDDRFPRFARWLLPALLAAACSSRSPAPPAVEEPAGEAAPAEEAPAVGGDWYPVAEDEQVAVRVERRLYQQAGHSHFLVRVRVDSRSDRPLGVDLRDYWAVIYPNQWGALREDHRSVIDEMRAYPKLLDAARCADLRRAFAAGDLTALPPGGAIEYYREFNASGRADVDAQATDPYLFVSLAGQTLVTDGAACDDLPAGEPGGSDLIIAAPVPWGEVPAGSRVIDESRSHPVARSAAGQAMIDLAQRSAGLKPGDDRECAATPDHPHFWSYRPQQAVAEVVDELEALCIAIGPHRGMNIARWCCPPALP